MLIKTLPVGQLQANCYIVTDENTLDCAVIDPGDESNTILDYIESNHLKVGAVMLTHGHYDHVGALEAVLEETGAALYLNEKDLGCDPGLGSSGFILPENGSFYDDGDTVTAGSLEFKVIAAPGHTPGGVCLVCEDALFTGDTLFAGSCGRTDLPGGSMRTEMRSLKKLCLLPGDYEVYPGHMDSTTLERERRFNYYCREAMAKF